MAWWQDVQTARVFLAWYEERPGGLRLSRIDEIGQGMDLMNFHRAVASAPPP
jgi:hypothetical protein